MKIRSLVFLLLLIFYAPSLLGQQYNLIERISIPSPVHVTADPMGHIYLQTIRGDIIKYKLDGEKLLTFNSSERKAATSIDASLSLRLFAFYKDAQSCQYFDRQLNPLAIHQLPEQNTSFFSLATPSSDNSIWLWDATQLSLKKYKPVLNTFTVEEPAQYYLHKTPDINQIREYQNKVYVNDKNHQVMVFDIFGNYIQKLPVTILDHFEFYRDELYWWEGNTIYFYHLYEMGNRKLELPDAEEPSHVLLVEDRIFIFNKEEMLIYRILNP